MALKNRHVIAIASLMFAGSAAASTVTADFSGVSDPGGNGATFTVSVGGFDVEVSAWSDTSNVSGDGSGDNTLRNADLDKFGSGWGIDNRDEDGSTWEHSADNRSGNDYDFFLFDFGTEVQLTGAEFSWLRYSTRSEISVASISNTLAGSLNMNTWGNVLSDAGLIWSDSFKVVDYEASIDAGQTTSQFWLLGAYNAAFSTSFDDATASLGNDGLKLRSVSFGLEIPEPHTALLMALGLAGLTLRRHTNK